MPTHLKRIYLVINALLSDINIKALWQAELDNSKKPPQIKES
jgi:hypothetical protein